MFENGSFWFFITMMILLFELYIPYRKRLFLSLATSCFICFAAHDYTDKLFFECVLFLAVSAVIYITSLCVVFVRKEYSKHTSGFSDLISLGDVEAETFGAFFCDGKTILLKNRYERTIKKGDVLRIRTKDLEDDADVL